MKILGLIPARGGSKGVPRKNIRMLGAKPLIAYSIEAGIACEHISRLIVSTEDDEIAKISVTAGADIPFKRPGDLAEDQSPTIDTVLHALHYFENQNIFFDAICLLQPTVPFRNLNDLNTAIEKFKKQNADTLISVREVPHVYNPHWVYELDEAAGCLKMAINNKTIIGRRQDLPKAFHRDGSVYITKTSVLKEQRSLYGSKIIHHIMEASPNINIDTMEDWAEAETEIKKQ